MPYAALPSVVDGAAIQASWGNQVKANFDAGPNGLATTPGQLFYATAAGVLVALAPAAGVLGGPTPHWGLVGTAEIADGAIGSQHLSFGAVGTTALLDGAVTLGKLGIVPSALVVKTGPQACPSGNTTITFDAEQHDNNLMHDNATNPSRLTCRTAGVYAITSVVTFDRALVSNEHVDLYLVVNGAGIAAQTITAPTYANHFTQLGAQRKLAANDIVELVVANATGTALNVLSIYSQLGMTWISAG